MASLGAALGGTALGAAPRPLGASTDVIADVIPAAEYPAEWPFPPAAFARHDETNDAEFYSMPRLVKHIDAAAVYALTLYYEEVFTACGVEEPAVLDLCSSWVSHFPPSLSPRNVRGTGMNEAELSRNGQLSAYHVQDLNKVTTLPYPDDTFDVVTCTVSIDYLTDPRAVMGEVLRVLKPRGTAHVAISNRCFPSKAVAIWRATEDADHVWIVGAFFHYAQDPRGTSVFSDVAAVDLSPSDHTDPLFVVHGTKAVR